MATWANWDFPIENMKIYEQFEIKNLKRLRFVTYGKAFCHAEKSINMALKVSKFNGLWLFPFLYH